MQGQITSRHLLRAAGPSLHRPQSFPAPPAAHRHANRQIHYVVVCVRACRLQAADSQTLSQPRPPALVPSQISLPPLPSPSSHPQKQQLRSTSTPSSPAASSPQLFFFCHAGQRRSCERLPWCSVGYLCPCAEHRDGIVPVRPPSASNWFQPVPVSRHKALALQHGPRDTHRQESRLHLPPPRHHCKLNHLNYRLSE